ncbi:MAG: hypothetical protein IBX45_03865 [Campylobacterales bacterium]|nr:hypothetical protein [Campylobacterales bacterium]
MQIIAFLVLLLVVVALLMIDKETIAPKVKWGIMGVVASLVVLGMLYHSFSSKQQLHNREKINHFSQGGTLTCKGVLVDGTRFSYENGTASFVAKGSAREIRGVIIPLQDCEVASE